MKRFLQLSLLSSVVLLAAATLVHADPIGGPKVGSTNVEAFDTDSYAVPCWEDELTQVNVFGDGDTNLLVEVIDRNGKMVASQVGRSDTVTFRASYTGDFTIKVINFGSVYNHYFIKVW